MTATVVVCFQPVTVQGVNSLCSLRRAGIDDVETDVVEIEAKLDKVRTPAGEISPGVV